MKKLTVLVVALVISAGAFAQEKKMDKMDDMKKMDKMEKMDHKMGKMKDCVMMEDGKMMEMKEGNTMAMMKDLTFPNGTMVMKNGMVKMKDGKEKMLANGECIYMDGSMGKMKMDKMKMDKMDKKM